MHVPRFIAPSLDREFLFYRLLTRYQKLLALGKTRKEKLDDALQGYNLVREAGELSAWITEKVRSAPMLGIVAIGS